MKEDKILRIMFFNRKKSKFVFSIESLFSDLENSVYKLTNKFRIYKRFNLFRSKGIILRFIDTLIASFSQKDINHVTGDTHYLTFFLDPKKTILTIHDCGILKNSNGIKYFLYYFLWFWIPEKKVTFITVISENTKLELLKYLGCNPDKIKVIYNPVSDSFKKAEKIFNKKCPRILHIGFTKNKNLINHINAIKDLNCNFVIIGKPSDAEIKIMNLYKIEFSIYNNLSKKEIVQKYIDSDIILFASLYEGFGMPIVEAQSVGRPVVTSYREPMIEIAGKEGASFVDPEDYKSIREGLLKVIYEDNFRNKLIKYGYENVKKFSLEKITKQYLDLYREIDIRNKKI